MTRGVGDGLLGDAVAGNFDCRGKQGRSSDAFTEKTSPLLLPFAHLDPLPLRRSSTRRPWLAACCRMAEINPRSSRAGA